MLTFKYIDIELTHQVSRKRNILAKVKLETIIITL